ncbi:MAG: Manganese transport protein MntH [Candidatus Saccharibacteria bacterium]|nr:Manganese transport protein MntH [Candidatus Saccharibacteria bacterium]
MLLGPAFVAAVAYVDPGNFAANFSAGAQYGYLLLWVLIVANIMASLVQYLSAKVGLVTGQSLPEVIAHRLPTKARIAYWVQAELVAVATDIAEVIGGAIALQLLFRLPLVVGGIITGLVSLLLLFIYSRRGQKVFERLIMGLLLIIPLGFFTGLFISPPDGGALVAGLIPQLHGRDTVLLAVAMLGATVMPHVVYLHSALARDRHGKISVDQLKHFLRVTRVDVGIAMLVAGSVNIAMLVLAASALRGLPEVDTLAGIFTALGSNIGPLVAFLFALGLLVSGLASTAVGSHAGAVIMEGMLHRRISPFLRRIIVIIPAIVLLALQVEPTKALIASQVALSFGIPFALVPLAMVTASKKIMGESVNHLATTVAISVITAIVIVLNFVLIGLTFFG